MNSEPKPKRFPPFTAWALVGPVLIFGLGAIIGLTTMRSSDTDWFGIGAFARIFFALAGASVMAIACSIGAFVRKERTAFLSLFTAVPGLLVLLVFLYFLVGAGVKVLLSDMSGFHKVGAMRSPHEAGRL